MRARPGGCLRGRTLFRTASFLFLFLLWTTLPGWGGNAHPVQAAPVERPRFAPVPGVTLNAPAPTLTSSGGVTGIYHPYMVLLAPFSRLRAYLIF